MTSASFQRANLIFLLFFTQIPNSIEQKNQPVQVYLQKAEFFLYENHFQCYTYFYAAWQHI